MAYEYIIYIMDELAKGGHPRTQIQVTCTRRDLFRAIRSPAHAKRRSHVHTSHPTVTCTHRRGHLRTQNGGHMYTPAIPRSHVHTTTLDMG